MHRKSFPTLFVRDYFPPVRAFRFAHRAFIPAEILALAAALILRFFARFPGREDCRPDRRSSCLCKRSIHYTDRDGLSKLLKRKCNRGTHLHLLQLLAVRPNPTSSQAEVVAAGEWTRLDNWGIGYPRTDNWPGKLPPLIGVPTTNTPKDRKT